MLWGSLTSVTLLVALMFALVCIMQLEATEKSYRYGEKYVPLALQITSASIGRMDLTASFQTLIQLVSGMVFQINQNDCLKLCGWVMLT